MTHEEFVRTRGEWGVRGFFRPVHVAAGVPGVLAPALAYLVVLGGLLGGVGLAVEAARPWSALWAVPCALAFLCAPTNANLVDGSCFVLLALVVGPGAAVATGSPHHAACGVASFLAYVGGAAVRGTTMIGLEDVLVRSPAAFERLSRRGLIFRGRQGA